MKEIAITSKFYVYQYEELSTEEKELVDAAKKATETSYAPYSNFRVGAAVRLKDSTIVCGSNQENAAFPSGICAERTALFYANANHPNQPVIEMAVAAFNNGSFLSAPIPPCGACRQVILGVEERYKQDIRVLLYGEDGIYVIHSAKALLPLQFMSDTML